MFKFWKSLLSLFVMYAEAPKAGGGDGESGNAGGDGGSASAGAGDAAKGGTGDGAGNASGDSNAGKGSDQAAGAGETKFPENWREAMAGGDAKKLERLSRYATPQAAADALISVREQIAKGELKVMTAFPEKGTDAEKLAWRKEQGVPESVDAYYPTLKLAEGRVITDEDKPRVNDFITKMHARNASPDVVSAGIDAYYDLVTQETEKRLELDKTQIQATRDHLIANHGIQEFNTNRNLVNSMLDMIPEKARDLFRGARLADGSPLLGGNVDVFLGLAEMARTLNPAASIVTAGGDNSMASIDAEIQKNLKSMRTDRKAWDANPKNQERHMALLEAQARAKGSGK